MPEGLLVNRLGVFATLAESIKGTFGRTSLMKLCYFLQALRKVPLGYDFSLYSYGPFDSEVLSDLQAAENMGVLRSTVQQYAGGYMYDIKPSDKSTKAMQLAKSFLEKHGKDIEWVTATFGTRSASDLELLSTIVYVYRDEEIRQAGKLAERVESIKPHFSHDQVEGRIKWLQEKGLIS